jgi:hypothetical protein
MRYLVRYAKGSEIFNDLNTNDENAAHARLVELRQLHPEYKVWIADLIIEILAG